MKETKLKRLIKKMMDSIFLDAMTPEFKAANAELLKAIKMNDKSGAIAGCPWCKGAGASSTNRMVVYCHHERSLALEELVPLSRTMTQPNVEALAYDSVYMANISQLEMFHTQTIRYFDGI